MVRGWTWKNGALSADPPYDCSSVDDGSNVLGFPVTQICVPVPETVGERMVSDMAAGMVKRMSIGGRKRKFR